MESGRDVITRKHATLGAVRVACDRVNAESLLCIGTAGLGLALRPA